MNMKQVALVMVLVMFAGTAAFATPSTQIWIPSTDIQPFKKLHFGFDQYIKARKLDGTTREPNVINNGLTIGGALSYGVAWKFAPNVGVILGMDDWNNSNYKPTYTIQVDIDL